MEFNDELMKRIWKNIDKEGEGGCWLSRLKPQPTGYCRICIKNCSYNFHRVMLLWGDQTKVFEFNNGKIWLACHSCRNRHCVNPEHLRWGTYQDNADDMMRDGTHYLPKGEKHPKRKLNDEQVLSIRREYEEIEEITYQKLADKYGVSRKSICNIIRRDTWTHI
jgi:hypothetical protein